MEELKVKLYTVSEAAEILRFSPMTLYRWIHEGKIRALKFGTRSYRIRKIHIEELLDLVKTKK